MLPHEFLTMRHVGPYLAPHQEWNCHSLHWKAILIHCTTKEVLFKKFY